MIKVIVDTSVIIDHLRGISPDFKTLETLQRQQSIELCIPHVVIIELFTGRNAKKKRVRDGLDALLSGLDVVGLSVASAKKAGELLRTYVQVPDPFDAIIAALAWEHDAQIATHNQRHFRHIPSITLFEFTRN